MTIETTDGYSGPYLTNGVTVTFPFTFKALEAGDVAVTLDGAEVDAAGYSVSVNAGGGGSVTFAEPPAAGQHLVVLLDPEFTQPVSFENGSAWLAEPVNTVADRAAQRAIWLRSRTARAPQVPLGEMAPPIASLDDADGKVLAVINGIITPIDNDPAFAEDAAARAETAAGSAATDRAAVAADRALTLGYRDGALAAQGEAEQAAADAQSINQGVSMALAAGTISDLVGERIYDTRALLEADLVPADGEYALVVADDDASNRDLYRKNGATTTGSWDGPLGIFEASSALAAALRSDLTSWYPLAGDEVAGKYWRFNDGAFLASTPYRSFDKLTVVAGETLRISSQALGTDMAMAVWFDAAGDFLSYTNRATGTLVVYDEEEVVVPAGAASVGVTSYLVYPVVQRNGVDPTLKSVAPRTTVLEGKAEIYDENFDRLKVWYEPQDLEVHIGEYYGRGDGSVQVAGPFRRLAVDVLPGSALRFTTTLSGGDTAAIVWFNEVGARIGQYLPGANGVIVEYEDEETVVPQGAFVAGITSFYGASGKNPAAKLFGISGNQGGSDRLTEVEDKLRRIGNTTDRAKGLTLLFTGTSIYDEKPTGGLPIPEQAAALLGATANNQALSSSMIRAGDATIADGAVVVGTIASNVLTVTEVLYGEIGVGMALSPAFVSSGTTIGSFGSGTGGTGTYTLANGGSIADVSEPTTIFIGDDPLGWSGRGYPTVTRALSHTAGEKEEIILNWSKWQPLLTASPPASLDANAQALIRGASFESRILPHLDDADALVVEHVMNDSIFVGHNGSVADIPADLRDRCTFIGAFNWLMDRVQAYRDANELPPLPVVFSGSYENTWHPFLLEAQEKAAALWQYPIIRTADKTGWSQQTITTEGYWSGGTSGTWVASGGSPQTITFLNRALPDNLHPHKDDSNAACALLARILAVGLRDTL